MFLGILKIDYHYHYYFFSFVRLFKWGKGDIPRKPWRDLNKLPKRKSVSSFLEFLITSDLVLFATLVPSCLRSLILLFDAHWKPPGIREFFGELMAKRCWLVDLIWMILSAMNWAYQWNPLASSTYHRLRRFLGVFHETIQENIFGKITKVLHFSWSRCQRAMIGGSMLYLDLQHAAGTLNGCFRCGNVSAKGYYLGCTLW